MFVKFLLVLTALGVSATSAWAYTDDEIEEHVRLKLREMHPNDLPSEWTRLGANAPAVILRIARETDRRNHKSRLLGALMHFQGNEDVAAYLREQAKTAERPADRQIAIRSLGSVEGARAKEFLEGFLQDPAPAVRLAAADGLIATGDPQSIAAARAHASKEKAPGAKPLSLAPPVLPVTELRPVSSSEDRSVADLQRAWVGSWKGMLVLPGAKAEDEPRTQKVTLTLSAGREAEWRMELRIGELVVPVSEIQPIPAAKGLKFRAALSGASEVFQLLFHRDPSRTPAPRLLQLRSEQSGATGLLSSTR